MTTSSTDPADLPPAGRPSAEPDHKGQPPAPAAGALLDTSLPIAALGPKAPPYHGD